MAGRFYLVAILVFEKLRIYDPTSELGAWAVATLKQLLRELGTS